MEQKVFLITGVSGGIGRALAVKAAESGHIVYGTLRKPEQMEAFAALAPGKTRPLLLDVNDHEAAVKTVDSVLSESGRIDVLVNNAGYGLFGAVEEVSMEESRAQMETNFFSVVNLCKLVLPNMRASKSGHIIQISSIAGFRGTEGLSIYNASKFALEGFSQAMAKEVAPLGIHVTLVEPGPFRTEWGGSSSIRSKRVMPEYTETAGLRIRTIQGYSGTQPGDPDKAAALIMEITSSARPPLHLPLGQLALEGFREKMAAIESDIQGWELKSRDTAF
jgi:NAD(P)-dependent dehydrogenase (short-subunit alcohol dehydrogenase family)